MEKDVDPNDTGSFDQMNLISLIARRPKAVESIEEMIEAIKVLTSDTAGDEREQGAIEVAYLKTALGTMGEKISDHEIEEIVADIQDITHEGMVQIDDLA